MSRMKLTKMFASLPGENRLKACCQIALKYRLSYTSFRSIHDASIQSSPGNDFVINPDFVNRNPCNLEQMLIALKPQGFTLDFPSKSYYYRLDLNLSNRNIQGTVVHNSGTEVVSASTLEWALKKHLYNTKNINSVINVARVLAQRCLESGIYFVQHEPRQGHVSSKLKLFLQTLEDQGLKINELDVKQRKKRTTL